MNHGILVKRSLWFHWRTNLGVLLGAAVATAILAGALIVGDSVRFSLRGMALSRIGNAKLVLNGHDRLFRAALADDLQSKLDAPVAPILFLPGTVSVPEGGARAHQVQVLGVEDRFWELGGGSYRLDAKDDEGVALNQRLAVHLDAKVGDTVILRIDKPDRLSRDAPLSPDEDHAVLLRMKVRAVLTDDDFGRFSLRAAQVPPFNAFVPLAQMQKAIAKKEKEDEKPAPPPANMLLVGDGWKSTLSEAGQALRAEWQLPDASLEIRNVPGKDQLEVRTSRIFLDPPVADVAVKATDGAVGILTYLVNDLRVKDKATPYSMVTGLQPKGAFKQIIPDDMKNDEIVVNQWLADDLKCSLGDEMTLKYYVVGPRRQLLEKESKFRVRGVLPIEGAAADRELMPDFPGLTDSENCREWDPGFAIDMKRIRDKDEQYWDDHKGTPKGFVTLEAAKGMWENRFGALTAIRYPKGTDKTNLESALKAGVNPSDVGLSFAEIRGTALAASSQGFDFGGLFIGFSFFLIVAALLLTGLLFALGVESRASEVGILLATGHSASRVRRLLLREGLLLATVGSVLGVFAGLGYARAMLYGLATIWRDAVQTSALSFHAKPTTLVIGVILGILVALFSIWLVLRKQVARPARELLSGGGEPDLALKEAAGGAGMPRTRRDLLIALVAAIVAVLIVVSMGARRDAAAAGAFFGAGALLLIAGIALGSSMLQSLRKAHAAQGLTVGAMGVRNSIRRRGRSLASLSLLACGTFMVIAVGANKQDPGQGAELKTSGTGGSAFFGETAMPVVKDLNTEAGREEYVLSEKNLQDVTVVPMRLREGDDASCLNLNRAQQPQLWGVSPGEMAGRFTFSKVAGLPEGDDPWLALNQTIADDVVPAIGDENTVLWGLGLGVGRELTKPYIDERGREFRVHIVGTVATSILQGALIISEEQFQKRFPSASGYRVFLVDAPQDRTAEVKKEFYHGLEDLGLSLTPSARRLGEFMAVQNTYLSTFLVLGGLGLLLGSVGLGVVVLRNVLDRRSELALMRAVGFRKGALRWLVASEHSAVLVYGMLCGVVSAVIAVIPALRNPGAEVPYGFLALTAATVLVSGLVWTWVASVLALRGPLLRALRNE